MTDREKLIALLCKKYDHFCDQCGVNKDGHYIDSLADYLISNGVTFQQWIPVSERLPEPETDVLTFCCGNIDILTYRYNKWGEVRFMFRDECGYWKETFGEVTHWMPLPEPPKEE